MASPCELHEIWPCAICNGSESRFQASLDAFDPQGGVRLAPGIILARYSGHCRSCGQNFGAGSPLRYSDVHDGWIATACCG